MVVPCLSVPLPTPGALVLAIRSLSSTLTFPKQQLRLCSSATMSSAVRIESAEQFNQLLNSSKIVIADCMSLSPRQEAVPPGAMFTCMY